MDEAKSDNGTPRNKTADEPKKQIKGDDKKTSIWQYMKSGAAYVCNPMNTLLEFKSLPKSARLLFVFLLAGLAVYFVMADDYSPWGWLSISGLVFSALNLVLVDNGKITSYLWGILCSVCSIIGAFHYQMYGDFVYYLFVFPWMTYGLGVWKRLAAETGEEADTQRLSVPRRDIPNYVGMFVGSYIVMYVLSVAAGGAIPIIDSLILSCGVVGQMFLSKSYKQQWIIWIAQDVIAVVAWSVRLNMAIQSGEMTTYAMSMVIMWGIFLMNAVYGAYMWYKPVKKER